jgi:DNA-binding transcriptional MocR family regulator
MRPVQIPVGKGSAIVRRMRDDGRPRYVNIASRFAKAIEDGTYTPGDRLPSIRAICRNERVSPSTAVQAFAHLEAIGAVEARPRSGFFVSPRALPPTPSPARPDPRPKAVTVGALVQEIYRAARDPRLVQLGASAPAPELLPTLALGRIMSTVARRPASAGVRYEMPPGLVELRRIAALRLLASGCELGPEDLIVTCGATEAILLSLLVITSPGDTVAVETPGFFGTLQAIEALGLRVVEVPSLPGTGLDVTQLERILDREHVAAVIAVPNFSNPVGGLMPDAEKKRLVELLSRRGLPLIEDDVYGDLSFEEARPRPAKAWDRAGLVILCGSYSKSLAPGYRVGFVAPGRFRDPIERLKFATNVASPTLTQRAVARFLGSGGYDRHLRRLRTRLEESVARTSAAVAERFPAGTRLSRPRGGCNLWVELPPTVDALALHAESLRAGVAIAPGHIFSATRSHRSCVRLNCGEPWSERSASAIATVGRIARQLDDGGARGLRHAATAERANLARTSDSDSGVTR